MLFERRRWTAKVLQELGVAEGTPVWSVLAHMIRATGMFDRFLLIRPRRSVLISALALRRRPEAAAFLASNLGISQAAGQALLDDLYDAALMLCFKEGEHKLAHSTLDYSMRTGQFRAPPVEALLHMRPRR